MGYFDYELESFDGARPESLQWSNHYTRARLANVQTRARNLSGKFPTTLFRIIRPVDYKKTQEAQSYWYAGEQVESPFMSALIQAEALAFKQGKRYPLEVSQWDFEARKWIPYERNNYKGEPIRYGHLATVHAHINSFYPGLFRICAPGGEPLKFITRSHYIDEIEANNDTKGMAAQATEDAAQIVPPGKKLDGFYFTGATHAPNLAGFADVYTALSKELVTIIQSGNLTPDQRAALDRIDQLTCEIVEFIEGTGL